MRLWYYRGFTAAPGMSHELLRRAIAEHTGDEEGSAGLVAALKREGSRGKPFIEGFSHFSISHSGDVWAVLMADSPCGLDIQFPRDCDPDAIEARFYAPEDRGSGDFFRVWTRREALVKAAGTSVAGTDIPPVSGDEAEYMGVRWRISDICIPGLEGLAAAVCVRAESGQGAVAEPVTEMIELKQLR